jgi:hypothetical protein
MTNKDLYILIITTLIVAFSGYVLTGIISILYHNKHPYSFKLGLHEGFLQIKKNNITSVLKSIEMGFLFLSFIFLFIYILNQYTVSIFIISGCLLFFIGFISEYLKRKNFIIRIDKEKSFLSLKGKNHDLQKYNQWEITNRDTIYKIFSSPANQKGLYLVNSENNKYIKVYGFSTDRDIQKLKDSIIGFLKSNSPN